MNPTQLHLFSAVLFLVCAPFVSAQDLAKELQALDSLRRGKQTPFAEVDERGMELLKKYPAPKDQGLIYYQLAHVHAQSGMVHPDRVIEYATKALGFPLELPDKLRLYTYWGDALQVGGGQTPFAQRRSSAVQPYLQGLGALGKLKLPDKAPEIPGVPQYDVTGPPSEVARAKKEHEEAVAARKRAILEQELVRHRDLLAGQIVGLYTRPPYATAELKREATRVLESPQAADKLVRMVIDKAADAKLYEPPPPGTRMDANLLAQDPALQKPISGDMKMPTIQDMLGVLIAATGLEMTADPTLPRDCLAYGSTSNRNVPAWRVMERLVKAVTEDGAWYKEEKGYRLSGTLKATTEQIWKRTLAQRQHLQPKRQPEAVRPEVVGAEVPTNDPPIAKRATLWLGAGLVVLLLGAGIVVAFLKRHNGRASEPEA